MTELKWKPLETLPWIVNKDFDEDSEYRYSMPAGIALSSKDDFITVVGHDVSGSSSRGCGCCSRPWKEYIGMFTGWCWVLPKSIRDAVDVARIKRFGRR